MVTHHGVHDCSPGREQGSVRWQILSGWGDGGIWGLQRTHYVQDINCSHICMHSPAHLLTSSKGKQSGAWQCHTARKYFSLILRFLLISLSLPSTSEQPDCCAMHAADCEIGNFMSHYLPVLIKSDIVVKTWKYLSVLIHRVYESAVSSSTLPSLWELSRFVTFPFLHRGKTAPRMMLDEVSSADLNVHCSDPIPRKDKVSCRCIRHLNTSAWTDYETTDPCKQTCKRPSIFPT